MAKFRYGLKNVHYYPATWNPEGERLTIEDGMPWSGAVTLTASKSTDTPFSDDGGCGILEVIPSEELELEIFTIPEDFKTRFLGEAVDEDGNIIDDCIQKKNHFALAFEIKQDTETKRYLYFYCTAEEVQFSTSTKKASIDIEPNKIKIAAAWLPKVGRKKETSSKTKKEAYDTWFTAPKVSRLI
jgi:phi13 family phage major tail protein